MASATDQVTATAGKIGWWQIVLVLMASVPSFLFAWQILVMSFLTPKLDYFCQPDITSPADGGADEVVRWQHADFHLWKGNIEDGTFLLESTSEESEKQLIEASKCNASEFNVDFDILTVTNSSCQKWLYDKSFFKETLVTQFDLVCSNDFLITISQSVTMLGLLFGVVISGIVSDKIGRKKTLLSCTVVSAVVGCAAAYANSFALFIVLRFFIAFLYVACSTTAYIHLQENLSGTWAVVLGIGLSFPWASGFSTLPVVAYFVPEWSWLQLTISLPMILFIPCCALLYESPRWLLAKGKLKEAKKVLEYAAKLNGRKWPEGLELRKTTEESAPSAGFADLFRTPNMRKKTLIQWFLWFSTAFIYYGLSLNTGTLIPGNFHVNFAVGGLIEFPSYLATIVVLLFLGRRLPLTAMFLLAGFSFLAVALIPERSTTALLAVASMAKMGVTAAFAVVYLYGAELFPTVLRQTGIGSSSMCARVGTIIAPFVGRELGKISRVIPMLIFAAVSLLSGLATLALPETKGGTLPDSVEEGEEYGKGQKICDCRLTVKDSEGTAI